MITGLQSDGGVAPCVILEPMNRVIFEAWVGHMLAASLRPGDIVSLDNLSLHKSPGAEAATKASGAWLLFLPPYSPHRNPTAVLKTKGPSQGNSRMHHGNPRTRHRRHLQTLHSRGMF
jgi:transposase